jgi:hypothetical protein
VKTKPRRCRHKVRSTKWNGEKYIRVCLDCGIALPMPEEEVIK